MDEMDQYTIIAVKQWIVLSYAITNKQSTNKRHLFIINDRISR